MSLIEITIGNELILRGTLVDDQGAPLTGADVTVSVVPPSSTTEEVLGTAVEEGTSGVYALVWEPDEEGSWFVRMDAAAPDTASAEGTVYVKESRFQ